MIINKTFFLSVFLVLFCTGCSKKADPIENENIQLDAITANAQDSIFNIHEFYPIENSHSYIEFSVKYMGFAMVKGRFQKFKGTFKYDENDISKTSVSLWIDVNSIDTDHDRRDKDLKSEDWFDAEKFPNITFVSKQIITTESGFELTGNLTIKTFTREVVIKMNQASGILKDIRGDSQVIFTGETTIDRTDFGVQGERWSAVKEGITGVADEIKIEVSILGKQINEGNFKNRVRNETRPQGRIYKAISQNGVQAGLHIYEEMMVDSESNLDSRTLNIAGIMLLKEGKINEAIEVFRRNVEEFSDEADLYNSLAEALAVSGNLEEAKINYQKTLEKDANNQNAREILRHLK